MHFNTSPLTGYQLSAVLNKALQCLKVDSSSFGTHSFRIGAATTAAEKGFSDEYIKQLGRWSYKVFRRYIRMDK